MVRLSIAEFAGNKVFCLRGSAICTVGLLIGSAYSEVIASKQAITSLYANLR